MKITQRVLLSAITVASACAMLMAQGPGGPGGAKGGGGKGGPPRPVLSVTSPAWPDGGEVPMKYAGGRGGENKSPMFEFHWTTGNDPAMPPDALKTYAIIFHDIENAGRGNTTVDTLHWSAFNIPGTAKSLPEGLGGGDLPDGTRNGAGIAAGRGTPSYFGPGAGVGPFHHYVFEFYALDTKLDLPATTSREDLIKAMDGHVIGKAAYVGRFHATP